MPSFDPISGAPISGGESASSAAASGNTSGVSSFNATRNQIIRQAALNIGAIGAGFTMNAQMISDFAFNLNAMVKRWQANGIHVWTVAEGTLFPVPSQIKYGAGGIGDDHITENYVKTAVTTAAVLGATAIAIDSTATMIVADNIGILLASGDLQWSTVVSFTATTVTIAAALTDSAAAKNEVFFYTKKIVRPLKVVHARRYDIDSQTETPVTVVARLDYRDLSIKTGAGEINQVFYDPQLATGYFHLWKVPAALTTLLKFTWHRPIQDFVASGDNPDLPQEWIQTIIFNLALVMAPQFNVPAQRLTVIAGLAAKFLDELMGFDRENESIRFAPNMDQY